MCRTQNHMGDPAEPQELFLPCCLSQTRKLMCREVGISHGSSLRRWAWPLSAFQGNVHHVSPLTQGDKGKP